MKVIDLGIGFPESVEEIVATIKKVFLSDDNGLSNYKRIFGHKWAESVGMTVEEIETTLKGLPLMEREELLRKFAAGKATQPEDLLAMMDAAGVEWGLVCADNDNEKTAELTSSFPERFKGLATANPHSGKSAVTELAHAVKELGFIAYYATPFDWEIRADDRRFYPLYAKAVELDIPVVIYSTMSYRLDLPMDIGRPLWLDRVAMDFPDLRIVAECGGWPWVPELIGVARRHKNVYINTCAHRPKHLAKPGSGWEMLLQFGNTLLQDQIVFSSGFAEMGLPLDQIVAEMKELPLKPEVKEKWLYKNTQRLFEPNRA